MELRIHSQLEHRVFYLAKFAEAVIVIHAFQKKARKTAKRDIDLAKQRFAELVRRRSKR
jgi:phage-related protein